MIFWGSGGRIWLRWVAWKAAMRVDFWMAERWNAGRSCWTSGRFMVDVAVDSMRCDCWTGGHACLRRPGRMTEAIVCWRLEVEVEEVAAMQYRNDLDVDDNASDVDC
jgi:hypothetical protein